MPGTSTKIRKYKSWKPILLVNIYRYAKAGLSDKALCAALNIPMATFTFWKKSRPEVREALSSARRETPDEESFVRYFYDQLDGRLQLLWDEIVANEYVGGGMSQINSILADHGIRARQALFLHALVSSHYNPSRAMQRVGLDKKTLDRWTSSDPDFAELIEEIQWHKGNFYEQRLVNLCEEGDKGAILFANRTFNKKRGYGQSAQLDVSIKGSVEFKQVVDLSVLDLSLEVRAAILAALRAYEEKREAERLLSQRPLEERLLTRASDEIAERLASVPE